jgi:hypothetical protein
VVMPPLPRDAGAPAAAPIARATSAFPSFEEAGVAAVKARRQPQSISETTRLRRSPISSCMPVPCGRLQPVPASRTDGAWDRLSE